MDGWMYRYTKKTIKKQRTESSMCREITLIGGDDGNIFGGRRYTQNLVPIHSSLDLRQVPKRARDSSGKIRNVRHFHQQLDRGKMEFRLDDPFTTQEQDWLGNGENWINSSCVWNDDVKDDISKYCDILPHTLILIFSHLKICTYRLVFIYEYISKKRNWLRVCKRTKINGKVHCIVQSRWSQHNKLKPSFQT